LVYFTPFFGVPADRWLASGNASFWRRAPGRRGVMSCRERFSLPIAALILGNGCFNRFSTQVGSLYQPATTARRASAFFTSHKYGRHFSPLIAVRGRKMRLAMGVLRAGVGMIIGWRSICGVSDTLRPTSG